MSYVNLMNNSYQSTMKKKLHELIKKLIGLDPNNSLGGMKSDLEHLKSSFLLIIYIAGIDGISPPENEQILAKIKSIALSRFETIDANDFLTLEKFCNYHIELINNNKISKNEILASLSKAADDFIFHTKRLEILGDRILILIYLSIIISYSDGEFSADEQEATYLAARHLNIKESVLENLFRLAKINTAMKGIALVDDPDYSPVNDLNAFYQEVFYQK